MKLNQNIYQPAEDSFLLEKYVKKFAKKQAKILDIGAGSGIQGKKSLKNGSEVLFADINKNAVENLKKQGLRAIQSNLFSNIKKNEKFDLIIFNPPYLPEHKYDKKKDTCGGKKGSETINRFLKQAKNHLNKNGKILLLTSSLTKGINWLNYKKKQIGKKKLFFEELYVWELKLIY